MLVKICGITRLEDARFAVECGAEALGFVFWPESPRWIDPDRARAIVSTLPPFVTPVGVFVNQAGEYVNKVAALARLGAVQLHGDETAAYAAGMTRPVIKAVALAESAEDGIDGWPPETMLLLDVHDPVRRGGTGRILDWTRASTIAARRPIVLAGGLTPDNVALAISRVQPFGIDVSSGVEAAPGVKDHQRLTRLFEVIRDVGPPQTTQWTQWTQWTQR
jgi:phosphoribosylanthranilate isomerase